MYYRQNRRRRSKKLLLLPVLLLLLVGGGVFAWQRKANQNNNPALASTASEPDIEQEDTPTAVSGKYLFSGTVVLARAVERYAYGDYSQPFSKMSTFKPEAYDAWMADLECPVTTNEVSYQWQIANTAFNCRPEWLPQFGKYFQLANIAANHAYDMGVEGFPETVEHLQKAGIQAVGNYTPREKDDICEVVGLPVRLKKADGSTSKGDLPVAFCAWHYFSFSPEPGEIELAQEYANVMPVFGFMHAGAEYVAAAGQEQRDIAHQIIDNGAEFVIGNSPHWVQDSEVYNDKLIVYSTGNFIFDQIDYETMRGVSIDVEMEIPYDENVGKWLQLGKECKARDDTCFEKAKEQGLKRVTITSLTYDAVGSKGGARRVTERADMVLQKAIEDRLDWGETLKELGQ